MRELRTRLALAWHVLRGRPTIYRMTFHGGISTLTDGAWFVENVCDGTLVVS